MDGRRCKCKKCGRSFWTVCASSEWENPPFCKKCKRGDTWIDRNDWWTPTHYTDMAMAAMGCIDLDPFSSAKANERIGAWHYFDKEADAFACDWKGQGGTVFMNPPYGRGLIDRAIELFLSHWEDEAFKEGIVLVNNSTETRWFQRLLFEGDAVCFPNHRIAFESPDNRPISSNTRGQAFFYFGSVTESFSTVFGTTGEICFLNWS